MASECKLCALLGSTTISDSLDGNLNTHVEIHARQLWLISQNHTKSNVKRTVPINRSKVTARSGKFRKEKSKKSALFTYTRKLIIIHGKSHCGMTCSQCRQSIRLHRITAQTAYNLINHACVHLNKDLYACRQCHLKFISKSGVCGHLHRIHSLSVSCANYDDMTEDHHSDIMDIVKVCFGTAPDKKLKITEFGKQKRNYQWHTPLLKVAYSFLAKYELGDCIQCQLCPSSISDQTRSNAARDLLDHARWHVDKPIFSCALCQHFASTESEVTSHLQSSHKVGESELKQNFKDESDKYFEELSSMLEDCFGEMNKERPPVISSREEILRHQAQLRIRSQCGANSLLAERQLRCSELTNKFQRSGKLQCRICHAHLAVVTGGRTNYVAVTMAHAVGHFNKILFSCRRCSYGSTSKTVIGRHVLSKHGISSTNEFDDRTDDFHDEFMVMLSKCFDWDMEPDRPEGSMEPDRPEVSTSQSKNPNISVAPISHLSISSQKQDNDLKVARYAHAYELIKNYAKDGKIICRNCSRPTSVMRGVGCREVFNHAIAHLDKHYWPYRCKLCSQISVNRANILRHLEYVHKDIDIDAEVEDMSDIFHSEIMEILTKCYYWNV